MLFAGLLLSVAIPLFAGLPWLWRIQPDGTPGRWPIALSHGYVLGLVVIVAASHLLSLVHLPIGLLTMVIAPLIVGAIGAWRVFPGLVRSAGDTLDGARTTWRQLPRATRVAIGVALGLIVVRMVSLAVESVARPFFPWEVVSGVATKARVWYDLGSLVPFVQPSALIKGAGHFTDADPAALTLPSLLMVWSANAIGRWQEGAVAFPWWMLGVSLALAFYGHLRQSGSGIAYALVVTYVLVSLPLVDVHIALSGAPEWIAAVGVALAGCALLRWLQSPAHSLLFLVVIGSVLAALSLAATWPWFAIFVIAAAQQRWPHAATKLAVGVPLLVLLVLLALMQMPMTIGGKLLQLKLAGEWKDTPESLLLLDNWHLLFGLPLLVAIIGWRCMFSSRWRAQTWVVAMGLGLMVVRGMLALPPYWLGGLRDFSFAGLQVAAIMLFWFALLARDIAAPAQSSREVAAI
jgi:hypothetical protein